MKKVINIVLYLVQLAICIFLAYVSMPAFSGQIIGAVIMLPVAIIASALGVVSAIILIIIKKLKHNNLELSIEVIYLIIIVVQTLLLFLKLYNII